MNCEPGVFRLLLLGFVLLNFLFFQDTTPTVDGKKHMEKTPSWISI